MYTYGQIANCKNRLRSELIWNKEGLVGSSRWQSEVQSESEPLVWSRRTDCYWYVKPVCAMQNNRLYIALYQLIIKTSIWRFFFFKLHIDLASVDYLNPYLNQETIFNENQLQAKGTQAIFDSAKIIWIQTESEELTPLNMDIELWNTLPNITLILKKN